MKNKKIIRLLSAALVLVMLCVSITSCNKTEEEPEKIITGSVDAVPTELKIYRMPNKTEYGVGEEFKLTGMVMQVIYSDGTSKYLAPTKCERDVTGPLSLEHTQITFTYNGLSVVLPISVVNKCNEHTYELVSIARKTNYVVGEKFYNPYSKFNDYPVYAVCSQCGAEGSITSCTVSSAAMTIETTSVPVTAIVDEVEVTGAIPVKVFESKLRLDAEKFFDNAKAELVDGTASYDKTQNYALFDDTIKFTKEQAGSLITLKGGTSVQLGTQQSSGHFVEFHVFVDKAGTYEIVFSGLSTNVDAYVNGGATRVADTVVNNILTFKVNGKTVKLSDDAVIRGVGADDGVYKAILGQFTYISLGEFELQEGENVIKIIQKNYSGYFDLASDHNGNRYAATKVDAIELYAVEE